MRTVARGGDNQVPPAPLHTYTQRARNTHSPPIYLYPWVDILAIARW